MDYVTLFVTQHNKNVRESCSMKTMMHLLFLCILLVCLFAGCSSGSSNSTTSTGNTPQATKSQPTPTPSPTPQPKTAAQFVQALKDAGMPIGEIFAYDASNDPNHLLGRPNQY